MNHAASLDPDALLSTLKLLCAQASVTGQARDLADGADSVITILRDVGLDCRIVQTGGAPIVLGRYDGGAARTILLYGRYDVPPVGLRRNWATDPFQPVIRDDALYARGAVVKAELAARAAALRSLVAQGVPANIVVVVEGESLVGSAHLEQVREAVGPCDACLWSGGSFDAENMPLLYTGVKGLLQVELEAVTATTPVPTTYAATVPNPTWTLVLALASIKSEFEEILIEGFYDDIAPPSRQALNAVQRLDVGEQARREAWGVTQFIANVKGPMLARTETFSPTCTVNTITVAAGDTGAIPQQASASLQFHLVPGLRPARLFELLKAHLETRGFTTLRAVQTPGAYEPMQGPALQFNPAQVAVGVYGKHAQVVPLAPFAAPAALLAAGRPFVSCGLERPTSGIVGANEHVPLVDLHAHARLVLELLQLMAI